ncbi:hypothetical protein [Pantoea anthophila]|uniref:hypothetical protein n=1 Tax=Pantoea anthophila TaxID=470931 RepID=UPI00128CEBA9|nr:hypothetical protein [Pantoea anthophila]
MKKKKDRADKALTIPVRFLATIFIAVAILLISYVYFNYVAAAPLTHSSSCAKPALSAHIKHSLHEGWLYR